MLPTAAGSILLKKCESESELEHQKSRNLVQQFGCLMQTGTNGYAIYKNVGVMHAVVLLAEPNAKKLCPTDLGANLHQKCKLQDASFMILML